MQSNRLRRAWSVAVPVADPALQESALRVSARTAWMWGAVLARLRAAGGQSPAEQAAALGITESALAYFCLCRLPRPDRGHADLAVASALAGIGIEVLQELLRTGVDPKARATTVVGGAA